MFMRPIGSRPGRDDKLLSDKMMKRESRWLWTALLLCLPAFLPCILRADAPASENIYQLGSISPADLTAWQPLGAVELQVSPEGKVDPYFTLEATDDLRKAGAETQGVFRKGLNLPLPTAIWFQAYVTNAALSLILRDSDGHQFVSPSPLLTKAGDWTQISVPLDAASGLRNLSSIGILFTALDGGKLPAGIVKCRFSHLELIYPTGTGPQSGFTRQDLEKMVVPLDAQIARIQTLIPRTAAAGAETRYFRVSLTVLKRYRGEVLDMMTPGDPYLAKRTANYLLDCAARTERGLNDAIKHPKASVHVPQLNLTNLKVRDGSFYSGNRPVCLLGVCGWFGADRFDYLADSGFSVVSGEIGPSAALPAEDKTDTSALKPLESVLDAAANHNIAFDLLLSPHYIPAWAYQKWPDIDPTDRRHNNQFMPWDVRNEHFRAFLFKYLSVVIPAFKDKPALLDYDLINEAWYGPFGLDSATLAQYRAAGAAGSDWDIQQQYTTPQVSLFVKWYYDQLRAYDETHPVYVKVLGSDEILCADREAIGDILSANGMDSYPQYPAFSGDLAADMTSTLMRLDFHRSLTPDKPILDGEYHVFSGTYDYPDNYVRTALWAAALHGKDAASLWTADRSDTVSVAWHANGMEVTGHTALDFERLGSEIQAFQRQGTSLAIFYDWNRMREPYQAALFQDRDVNIITDKRIQDGKISRYKLLVLPGDSSPDAEVARRIAAFKKDGGLVVRCKPGATANDLYPILHAAVTQAHFPAFVRANHWGIECRSVILGGRKLFYLINYGRKAADVTPASAWSLKRCLNLRTQMPLDGRKITLQPLEFQMLEALPPRKD